MSVNLLKDIHQMFAPRIMVICAVYLRISFLYIQRHITHVMSD
jgi:hypothetical protein